MELGASMKITSRHNPRSSHGYALLVVLTFMGIMLVLFAMMMTYTLSNAKITKRNNQYNASQAAAQAAVEKVLSQMTHDFEFQSLSNSGSYYGSTFIPSSSDMSTWPYQYIYSTTNGASNQISVNMGTLTSYTVPLSSQYAGLRGYEQTCTITATATPTNNSTPAVPATVCETIQFAEIPLFQFAIFYNMNLEIAAAQTLNIQGAVYSNGGIWSGSSHITFASTVSAVGLATNSTVDPFCYWSSGNYYSGSGLSTYSISGQPTSGNDTLTLPVGTNNNPASVESIINIPPTNYMLATAAAFSTNGQLYLANEADLFLTNFPNGTNQNSATPMGAPMALYYSDYLNGGYLNWATNDFFIVSNMTTHAVYPPTNYIACLTNYFASAFNATNSFKFALTNGVTSIRWTNSSGTFVGTNIVWYMGYSFLTNVVYYDWREGWNGNAGPPKTVQAVQLDLKQLNLWLTNNTIFPNLPYGGSNYNYYCQQSSHKNHPVDSIYIYNAVPLSGSTLPAARVLNGGMMPPAMGSHGFTLATCQPLYVWGDYNVSNTLGSSIDSASVQYTQPAGLMADSISILSDSWNDTNSTAAHKSTDNSGGPSASTTEINAACLEGIVESTNNSASDAEGYSGGVENFMRLLENWGSATLWYNGSIIVMFPSQYATNCWQQTGGYYSAPTRKWAFDTNFDMDADLPPLTPQSQGVIRATWIAN
jgi:hypothetical protein